jgi:hypothetical protein
MGKIIPAMPDFDEESIGDSQYLVWKGETDRVHLLLVGFLKYHLQLAIRTEITCPAQVLDLFNLLPASWTRLADCPAVHQALITTWISEQISFVTTTTHPYHRVDGIRNS